MGITSFSELVTYLSSTKSERGLSEFRGKIAIIDGSHRLLKQCIGRIGNSEHMTNNEGKSTLHLYVTFITIMGLLDYGIQPFFVFEGKCDQSDDKTTTYTERKKVKDAARKKCDAIEDKTSPEYYKNLKKCFQLTHAHYDEVRKLLDLAGIPYIIAPGEGDPQCAAISKYYKLTVITDDADVLAFGASQIWKNFSLANKKTQELSKQTLIQQMYSKANEIRLANEKSPIEDFTHQNFIDYCIMLGTDYAPNKSKSKIAGHTMSKLFELFVLNNLDVEKTCEYINQNQTGIRISANFVDNWKKIKEKYLTIPVIHPSGINVLMKRPSVDKLIAFLCDENGLNRDFVLGKVMGLEKDYRLFNDVYSGNSYGQENDFCNFTSYRLKYGRRKYEKQDVSFPLSKPRYLTSTIDKRKCEKKQTEIDKIFQQHTQNIVKIKVPRLHFVETY
jgi:flap endonuclease-1